MAGKDDSVLDKAESLARRILERLGAKVDSKLGSEDRQTLSPREVGELTSRIERVIEVSLREDKDGTKRVAPNRYKVLFTYEETSRLNTQYIEELAVELKATIFEYINNRRYETRGPIVVQTGRDLFTKITTIKATFEGEQEGPEPSAGTQPAGGAKSRAATEQAQGARTVVLQSTDGRSFRFELKQGGAPAYVGRAAGNAVRIDDPSLSRMHCSIAVRNSGEVVVADLGSSNGTAVNDRPLHADEACTIDEGDHITVGDISLVVSQLA